jgi:fatty-acyl-CoA synthase
VLFGNQPEWVISCFAAAYAGATVVPLNTWHKRDEIAWTLRHARVKVLVAASNFLKQDYQRVLPGIAAELPALDAIVFSGPRVSGGIAWKDLVAHNSSPIEAQASPEDIAFILYTSGSTADPKGVLLRHGGVIENGYRIGARREFVADDRVWLGSPLFYGLGAANALPAAFTHGAALVLHDYFEAGRAIAAIREARATVWYGTGNMARAVLDHTSYARRKIATLEKGNAGTVAEYKRLTLVEMGIRRATPAYGLTECYGQCTGGLPDDPLDTKLHTNGTPLPGFEMSVVEPTTYEPLPPGHVGLVLLRGRTTEGYLDNPTETAKAVLPDGRFNTGDLGCLDAAGCFVFHSRLKEIIKRRGIGVSPVEVEQLLASHDEVADAHVVGVRDPVAEELVVAFVVGRSTMTESELCEYVRARAASFKVPDRIIFVSEEELPRLASGKVAKHRLVEMAAGAPRRTSRSNGISEPSGDDAP